MISIIYYHKWVYASRTLAYTHAYTHTHIHIYHFTECPVNSCISVILSNMNAMKIFSYRWCLKYATTLQVNCINIFINLLNVLKNIEIIKSPVCQCMKYAQHHRRRYLQFNSFTFFSLFRQLDVLITHTHAYKRPLANITYTPCISNWLQLKY